MTTNEDSQTYVAVFKTISFNSILFSVNGIFGRVKYFMGKHRLLYCLQNFFLPLKKHGLSDHVFSAGGRNSAEERRKNFAEKGV